MPDAAAARTPIIDTHVHFWDLNHPTLTYNWLAPGEPHPILGNIDGVKMLRYEAEHWWAEARFAQVEAVVHVQAADSPDLVEETRWLSAMHSRTGYPNAIVANANLRAPNTEDVLDAHLESPLTRGIRDFGIEPMLAAATVDPAFEAGLRAMAARHLVLDLDCEWPNMNAAVQLARRHDDLVIVLEHIGFPRSRDPEYHRQWQDGISTLANAPNVICKISGLGMKDPQWTVESIRPWVLHCVDAFGPSRCVIGSNWPLDRLYSSYDVVIDAYRACLSGFNPAEQTLMLAGTARRVYRL